MPSAKTFFREKTSSRGMGSFESWERPKIYDDKSEAPANNFQNSS